ncbi:MAG: PIG-L deacetylase family protein [Alphaproteobacteria bacterium]
MGFNKLNRWLKSKLHNYDLVKLVKSKEWKILPSDKICILAPHPDDETIGCGGLLFKYASQCDIVLLTDGRGGGTLEEQENLIEVRRKEFLRVMDYLKVNSFQILNAKDGWLVDSYDIFSKIDFEKYDYVLMPHEHDAHKDHIVVQAFFKRLCKENKKIKAKPVYYEIWAPIDMPNLYVDISDVVEKKKEAINFYESQIKDIDYASRILGLNHYRGIRHHIAYEESYKI